jgi:sucrose phosphorylase
VNCTYYDALGRNDRDYLLARAIQFFAPGVPQLYYVGLLAGMNDMELLERTGVGRDINRHYYTVAEVAQALERPVVQALLRLIRLRNSHPAFAGAFSLLDTPDHSFGARWENADDWAELQINFVTRDYSLRYSANGEVRQLELLP